ncbi:MAG: helix-turn-helix domain-containing protein [Mucilaginibacter sp.]
MKKSIYQRCLDIAGNTNRLHKISGVSQAALHKVETGKTKEMRLCNIKKLSKATGIPVAEFID